MYLDSLPFAQLSELIPCSWHVAHNYGNVPFVVVVVVVVVACGLLLLGLLLLLGWLGLTNF